MGTGKFTAGGNPAMDRHPIQAGVEILLVASCYRNWDRLRPDGTLGSYADFTSCELFMRLVPVTKIKNRPIGNQNSWPLRLVPMCKHYNRGLIPHVYCASN